jgi:hypothetical protein
MSARQTYILFAAPGRWREAPDGPARDVIVSLGNATLVLTDVQDRILGHWALAGIRAVGESDGSIVYTMAGDGADTLSIGDRDMNAAIAEFSCASSSPTPRARRTRRRRLPVVAPLMILGAVTMLAVYGPPVIRAQSKRLIAREQAIEAGDQSKRCLGHTLAA